MRTHLRGIVSTTLVLAMLVIAVVPLALHAAPMQRHVTVCAPSGSGSLPDVVANVAQSGDTVVFDQDCTIALTTPLVIPGTKNLTIDALAAGSVHTVILDGGGTSQLLHLQAINNQGPAVTLNGLTLRNGKAAQGGAIFNDQGALTITNAAILTSTASIGGGGIENAGGTLTVTNSTFAGNTVTGTAGATGGAIDNNAFGKLTIVSSSLSGNSVSSAAPQSAAGGGIFDFSQGANAVTLTDTLIAGNTGGNCNGADIGSENTNGVATGGHNLIGVRHNLSSDPVCGTDFTGITNGMNSDQVGTDETPIRALFGPVGTYGGHTSVLPLLPGSPAIDAGGASCPSGVTTDQRGSARPVNGACDIGAFESGGFTLLPTSGSNNQSALINTAFMQSLTLAVNAKSNGEPVAGGVINFAVTPAANGATATLSGSQATIMAGGQASVTATANGKTGMYSVTVSASGAAPATFTLTNTVQTLVITPATLPPGTMGIAYSATLTASGGTGMGYAFALASGTSLPAGLMLSGNQITGTPMTATTTMVTITVTDSGGFTGSQQYTLVINPPGVTMLTVTAPTGGGNSGTATMPNLKPGGMVTLMTVGTFNNGTTGPVSGLTYSTSNGNVVAVDPNTGVVSGISAGTATITITAPNGVKTTIVVTVGTIPASGLMNPNPVPMAHPTAPGSTAVPAPQPSAHPEPTGVISGSGQPQVAGSIPTATLTPAPQPARH